MDLQKLPSSHGTSNSREFTNERHLLQAGIPFGEAFQGQVKNRSAQIRICIIICLMNPRLWDNLGLTQPEDCHVVWDKFLCNEPHFQVCTPLLLQGVALYHNILDNSTYTTSHMTKHCLVITQCHHYYLVWRGRIQHGDAICKSSSTFPVTCHSAHRASIRHGYLSNVLSAANPVDELC